MAALEVSASQKSGGCASSADGWKPSNAVSKAGHFFSITVQAKPEQKIRFVISLRIRSSLSAASSAVVATFGSKLFNVFSPPLRSAARARMALNGVTNVFCHNIALGEREDLIEIPQFDYDKSLNFGSIEFGPQQKEALSQTRGKNPEKIEYVRLATLDSFEFTNVNLLKIDAEGMEMQILEGANQTISNCRPVMYIEFFKSDRTALQQKIISHDYDVHVNGVNFLCIPRERSADIRVRS